MKSIALDNIFDFDSTPKFLEALLVGKDGRRKRGRMKELSDAMRCHPSYVSQVIRGLSYLSVEQAVRLGHHLTLPSLEFEYLVALVERDRAGCRQSRRYFETKLEGLKDQRKNLHNRWAISTLPHEKAELLFFSNWLLQAVHGLCQIAPQLSERDLAVRLQVPQASMSKVIANLEMMGLLRRQDGKWIVSEHQFGLKRGSALSDQYHTTWRLKSIEALMTRGSESGQFLSSTAMISAEVAKEIESELFQFLDRIRSKIMASKSEGIYCLNLDFFPLLRN